MKKKEREEKVEVWAAAASVAPVAGGTFAILMQKLYNMTLRT